MSRLLDPHQGFCPVCSLPDCSRQHPYREVVLRDLDRIIAKFSHSGGNPAALAAYTEARDRYLAAQRVNQ